MAKPLGVGQDLGYRFRLTQEGESAHLAFVSHLHAIQVKNRDQRGRYAAKIFGVADDEFSLSTVCLL